MYEECWWKQVWVISLCGCKPPRNQERGLCSFFNHRPIGLPPILVLFMVKLVFLDSSERLEIWLKILHLLKCKFQLKHFSKHLGMLNNPDSKEPETQKEVFSKMKEWKGKIHKVAKAFGCLNSDEVLKTFLMFGFHVLGWKIRQIQLFKRNTAESGGKLSWYSPLGGGTMQISRSNIYTFAFSLMCYTLFLVSSVFHICRPDAVPDFDIDLVSPQWEISCKIKNNITLLFTAWRSLRMACFASLRREVVFCESWRGDRDRHCREGPCGAACTSFSSGRREMLQESLINDDHSVLKLGSKLIWKKNTQMWTSKMHFLDLLRLTHFKCSLLLQLDDLLCFHIDEYSRFYWECNNSAGCFNWEAHEANEVFLTNGSFGFHGVSRITKTDSVISFCWSDTRKTPLAAVKRRLGLVFWMGKQLNHPHPFVHCNNSHVWHFVIIETWSLTRIRVFQSAAFVSSVEEKQDLKHHQFLRSPCFCRIKWFRRLFWFELSTSIPMETETQTQWPPFRPGLGEGHSGLNIDLISPPNGSYQQIYHS